MDLPGLPTDVLDLIARHLDSMEQVQALLVLRREPERFWQVNDMVSEVRASPEKVAAALAILHNNKLGSVGPGDPKSYRYSAGNGRPTHQRRQS